MKPLIPLSTNNSKNIKISDFENYVLQHTGSYSRNNEIVTQYQEIPKILPNMGNYGRSPKNVSKNRYPSLAAYDCTRVVLKNNPGGDYINANYVEGYRVHRAFIATQAPLPSTVGDFWYMIWQEKVETIVMLTQLFENDVVKSEQYWPDSKDQFGTFLIENISTKNYPDYVHRELILTYKNQVQVVNHLQYVTWPDHGIPENPDDFTVFMKKFVELPRDKPIVVHCNAGCGRTGTLILCDIVLRMAAKERRINFVEVLVKMREQRASLVNSIEQYIFAHFVVLECMTVKDFSITITGDIQRKLKQASSETAIKLLMNGLDKVCVQHEKTRFWSEKRKNWNNETATDVFSKMNYINAVNVDGYRLANKFLVVPQPLPNTLFEFWQLIINCDISVLVSLNRIEDCDPKCPVFWPRHSNDTFFISENVSIRFHSEINCDLYRLRIVEIDHFFSSNKKFVNIFEMTKWNRETLTPSNVENLISLWRQLPKVPNQIAVTCYDGITASGLFVALCLLLEKIDRELICDVFSAIRTIRRSRNEFVRDVTQVKFLYTAVQKYIEYLTEDE